MSATLAIVTGRQFATYAAMQAYAPTLANGTVVTLISYLAITGMTSGPGKPQGGGLFSVDTSDTTTADDGGMTCVTAAGQRLKRIVDGYITPEMFGALVFWGPNSSFGIDSAPAWRRMAAWLAVGANVPRKVLASSAYLFRTADPNITLKTCVQFTGGGIILEGDRANSEANNAADTIAWDGTAITLDSMISLLEDGMTMRNIVVNAGGVADKALFLSAGSFPSRMHFENCQFAGGASYAVYGGLWGSTWLSCLFFGGSVGCFCLTESTSHFMANCYANDGGTFGYNLAGFYGALIDMSCDNITSGIAYVLTDRMWICNSLACENCEKILQSTADNLVINGLMTLQDAMGTDWMKIISGHAIIKGFMPVAKTLGTPICQVQTGASLVTDLPYEEIRLVDGSNVDQGFGETFFAAISSDAGGGGVSNNPGVQTYPFTTPLIGGVANQQSENIFGLTGWAASTAKALNAYVYVSTRPTLMFKATTAGTTGSGSAPSWPSSAGGTVTDGTVVWTAVLTNADVFNPIAGWSGPGGFGLSGTYTSGRQPLRFTSPLAMRNVGCEWTFQNIDFYFDFSDNTKDCFNLFDVKHVVFDNCTFHLLSAARAVFGGVGGYVNATVLVRPNCRLFNDGLLAGTTRGGNTYYWRAGAYAPSQAGASAVTGIRLDETRAALPTATLWDPDIDLHLEAPDANGYLSRHVSRAGWIPHYTWSAAKTVAAGDTTIPTADNGHYYTAGGSGTTAGSEPTWPTSGGSTVTDNGITWTESGGSALVKRYDLLA